MLSWVTAFTLPGEYNLRNLLDRLQDNILDEIKFSLY